MYLAYPAETVAFLLGFYDQFIDSIDDLITGSREKRKRLCSSWIKLGTGWVCGMILAILILASVFDAHIYAISSCLSDLLFCHSDYL